MAAPLRIQSDWAQALRKDEGEAWLSCHPPGKPTLYGSLTCQGIGQDGIPEVTASEGFIVNEINKITCLDISSGGGLGVSSSTDGSMKIWQASNGELRRVLEGHVFDVNCCRFFPSGLVVLSGGMDAQLKIWSAEDASCVVTFKGHRGGILDTAIVDRGRNVVSGSRDGTARLWDCGRSACLGVIADCGSSINGVAVGAADNSINLGSPEQTPSEREVGTESKMLLLAREDKKLQCLGLQSRQPVFLFVGSDAFNCCTFLSGFLLLAGTQDGNIYQLDVRSPRAPVQVIHRSGAPVLSLLSFRDGFIASQGDGSCFIVQQDLDYLIELTGTDCDPVFKVATWEKQIYTCCRDGLVRRYQLSDL
ncbi:proteasomal ATPase-associated factor 1 isoform X2 [Phoca vitulina]|uniref:proteasomal ATPase-associated factor 1 isoform X2 n=1 Tax=Phoca vitulina TaxID=9720 RepID=UPI001395F15A|nr:proteasomal ATPase-associated factor 1 isoform X2 [Phoca vitulina]